MYSAGKSDCTDPVAGDVLSHIGYYETKTGDRDKLSYVHKNLRNPEKKQKYLCQASVESGFCYLESVPEVS